MKRSLTYLLAGLFCASVANAAVSNSNTSSNLPNPPAYGTSSGLSLGLMQGLNSTLSAVRYDGLFRSNVSDNVDRMTSISLGYNSSTIGAFGFEVGADYENYTFEEGESESINFGLYSNANYTLGSGAYTFIGVNLPNFEQESGAIIKGKLGYQLGGGYMLSSFFGIEILMKNINGEISYEDRRTEKFELKTFGLRGKFIF
jgi:hypothetical protein